MGYVALWRRVFVQERGGYWIFRDYGLLTALYAVSEGFVFNPPRFLDLLIPIEYSGPTAPRGTTRLYAV